MTEETKPVEREAFERAARNADWVQVVMNGGPPCFHFQAECGKFCLRSERWFGHEAGGAHKFVSFAEMLSTYGQASSAAALERARKAMRDAAFQFVGERIGTRVINDLDDAILALKGRE